MPIDATNFFNQVNNCSNTTQLHIDNNENVSQGSGLHGFKKLSFSAHRTENRATVQAFLNALSHDPRYSAFLSEVRVPLDQLMNTGKPLTAKQVRETKLSLDIAKNINMGRQLVTANKLPPEHATSFGIFCTSKGLSLDNAETLKIAIKSYYLDEVIPKQLDRDIIAGSSSELKEYANLLKQMLSLENGGIIGKLIDKAMAEDTFGFNTIQDMFLESGSSLDFLAGLKGETLEKAKTFSKLDELCNLLLEAPARGADLLEKLSLYAMDSGSSLATQELRADVIASFMVDNINNSVVHDVMDDNGLSKEFADTICHNVEVTGRAKQILAQDIGSGKIPTEEQVNSAVIKATQEFVTAHKADLQELMDLAVSSDMENIIAKNLSTLLREKPFLDSMFSVLSSDDRSIDADFMQKLVMFSSNAGDNFFTADMLRILLAQHGIASFTLPAFAEKFMEKLGVVASELYLVTESIQEGKGGVEGPDFLEKGKNMCGVLESFAKSLFANAMGNTERAMFIQAINAKNPNMPVANMQGEELSDTFMNAVFRKEMEIQQLSDISHDYVVGFGVNLPELAASEVESEVYERYISETGKMVEEKSRAFMDLFQSVFTGYDLTGIDIDGFDVSSLSIPILNAIRDLTRKAVEERRSVSAADVIPVAEAVITESLLELKELFTAIDALPDRPTTGELAVYVNEQGEPLFNAEEKKLLKNCLITTGVRDLSAAVILAHGARIGKGISSVVNMSSPVATAAQLAETARDLASAYKAAREKLPNNFSGSEDAYLFMAKFSLKAAGLSEDSLTALFENLNSDLAQQVAATFVWLRDKAVDVEDANLARQSTLILQALTQIRVATNIEKTGNCDRDPLYFSAVDITHPSEIPSGIDGCMNMLKTMSRSVISFADVELSKIVPPLNKKEWNTLKNIIDRLEKSAGNCPWINQIPNIVSACAHDLLQAMEHNKGKELSPKQLWDVMIGGRRPSGLENENFTEVILNTVNDRYMKMMKEITPEIPNEYLKSMFTLGSSIGVTPKRMFALMKPGATLSLADIVYGNSLSSMRAITADNAYGLVTDFRRQNERATLSFIPANGNSLSVHPHFISDSENTPDYPEFVNIIDTVRSMTHSEGQFRRVMQGFSQASLISPRVYSTLFPGVEYSEHGNFVMKAQEQEDRSIILDISTDETMPLALHQQFKIAVDGTCTCTDFTMKRPRA